MYDEARYMVSEVDDVRCVGVSGVGVNNGVRTITRSMIW